MEKPGMGSTRYRFVDIDYGDAEIFFAQAVEGVVPFQDE